MIIKDLGDGAEYESLRSMCRGGSRTARAGFAASAKICLLNSRSRPTARGVDGPAISRCTVYNFFHAPSTSAGSSQSGACNNVLGARAVREPPPRGERRFQELPGQGGGYPLSLSPDLSDGADAYPKI